VDLVVEQEVFVGGMENLEEAIGSFFYFCFAAHLEYRKGSGVRALFFKLDENGKKSALTGKDLRHKSDKGRGFTRAFSVYVDRTKEGRN
jgi:hypothetical protein